MCHDTLRTCTEKEKMSLLKFYCLLFINLFIEIFSAINETNLRLCIQLHTRALEGGLRSEIIGTRRDVAIVRCIKYIQRCLLVHFCR